MPTKASGTRGEHEDGNDEDEGDEEESDEGQAGKNLTQKDVDRLIQEVHRKERRKAEEREAKLTERENELNRRELRAQAAETLSEKSLPKALPDVLDYAALLHARNPSKRWISGMEQGCAERRGRTPERQISEARKQPKRRQCTEKYSGCTVRKIQKVRNDIWQLLWKKPRLAWQTMLTSRSLTCSSALRCWIV